MSKSFCILPWTHICSDTSGNLLPCCRHRTKKLGNINEIKNNGLEFLNNIEYQKIRKSMINDISLSECEKCYYSEQNGEESYREACNKIYKDKELNRYNLNFEKLKYLEFSLDTYCNLECRMCDSRFSTRLIERDKFLKNKVYKNIQVDFQFLRKIDVRELTMIKLLGGEPLISPNLKNFLEFIIEIARAENITLKIITNGTHQLSNEIISVMNKFKKIIIVVSLDSYHSSNDYQRFRSNYKEVWKNALNYQKILSNSEIKFHTTISIYTANTLDFTLNKFIENNFVFDVDFVRNQEMSLSYVPDNYADWLLTQNTANSLAYTKIENFLSKRTYDENKWNLFLDRTKKLDAFYQITLETYNKNLYDFLKNNYSY